MTCVSAAVVDAVRTDAPQDAASEGLGSRVVGHAPVDVAAVREAIAKRPAVKRIERDGCQDFLHDDGLQVRRSLYLVFLRQLVVILLVG